MSAEAVSPPLASGHQAGLEITLQERFIAVFSEERYVCTLVSLSDSISPRFTPSEAAWKNLLDHLYELSLSDVQCHTVQSELFHYFNRLIAFADSKGDKKHCSEIRELLHTFFPSQVEDSTLAIIRNTAMPSRKKDEVKNRTKHRKRSVTVTNTKMDITAFTSRQFPARFHGSLLTSSALGPAIDCVASEILAMDRSFHHPVSHNFPQRPSSSQGLDESHRKPPLLVNFTAQTPKPTSPKLTQKSGPVRRIVPGEKVQKLMRIKGSLGTRLVTGDDVIRAFATGQLGSDDELYLNYAGGVPWNSYRLVVVPKRQANPEHFVASSFGILHVYPDGEVVRYSFAGWSRDDSVCAIISQIPVFKYYLQSKMVRKWKNNIQEIRFFRRARLIQRGLRFHPLFFLTLWKVQSLCEDLHTVVVKEGSKIIPLGEYNGEEFQRQSDTDKKKVRKFLNRFIKYTHRSVVESIDNFSNKVLELETKQRHQPFVSGLPISIQKEQHMKLDSDLEEARHRMGQTGVLVSVVKEMMISCLRNFTQEWYSKWIELVVQDHSEEDEEDKQCDGHGVALFTSELNFTSTGTCARQLHYMYMSPINVTVSLCR